MQRSGTKRCPHVAHDHVDPCDDFLTKYAECLLSILRAKKQLTGIVSSGLLGWWGFPWGFIYTPIQFCRNIAGILGAPDPNVPSEQYELLIRLDLAARVAAGEPLPSGRSRSQTTSRVAPSDDRIPVKCDDCGKHFKAKAAMAGKSGKCPGCGSPITVPEADEWVDDEDVYETDDEWGGDSYDDYGNEGTYDEDNAYADDWGQSSSPRGYSGAKKKRKPKKKTWTPLKIGIVFGLGIGALNIFAVILGLVLGLFEDDPGPPQFGQNNPIVVPDTEQPNFQRNDLQNSPELESPERITLQPNDTPPPHAPNLPIDNAAAGNAPAAAIPNLGNNPQPGTSPQPAQTTPPANIPNSIVQTPPVKPLDNVDQAADIWVVLSNLRASSNAGPSPFNKPLWSIISSQVDRPPPRANMSYTCQSNSAGARSSIRPTYRSNSKQAALLTSKYHRSSDRAPTSW